MSAQEKLHLLLHFKSADDTPPVENDTLRLPSIHPYLPPNSDTTGAVGLMTLYRTHCISVIDSFRFCKEKNLFRHFSAFQGTLTVPVQKLLVNPDIAPWIEECDWLMYQKMVAFIAPLTTQVVPEPVVKAFTSISRRLVTHVEDTFKTYPEHVSSARVVPARLFCHLLKRMLDVNRSANSAAAWLCHIENRTKMWEEFHSLLNVTDIICKARIPRCSLKGVVEIFKDHTKNLLSPLDNHPPSEPELYEQEVGFQKFTYPNTESREYTNFPDRWIAFILQLQDVFPGHAPQCIIDKADSLWTAILHRLTLEGAESFSAWWLTKVFFMEMLQWQAEMGGFMLHTPKELRAFEKGPALNVDSTTQSPPVTPESTQVDGVTENLTTTAPPDDGRINVPGSSDPIHGRSSLNNDDSAIALDEDSMLLSGSKYADLTVSDPAEVEASGLLV